MSARVSLTVVAFAALAFAALVELLDAAGLIVPNGSGEDPTLVTAAVLLGLAATVVAAGLVVIGPAWARALPVAAAAFLVARFESYDGYYAPSLHRFSDGGFVAPWWVWFLCVAAAVVTVVPRARGVAPAPILAITCTALVVGLGH